MENMIEKIDGMIAELEATPNEQMTPYSAIARGRLEAGRRALGEHARVLKERADAQAKLIADKKAELEKLQAAAAPAPVPVKK